MRQKSHISKDAQQDEYFVDVFKIVGATHNDNKEVIWICKYFEPFNVEPVYDSATRKNHWKMCDQFFGKYIKTKFFNKTSRGTPIGKALGLEILGNEGNK